MGSRFTTPSVECDHRQGSSKSRALIPATLFINNAVNMESEALFAFGPLIPLKRPALGSFDCEALPASKNG
jgi:hypothetical protein